MRWTLLLLALVGCAPAPGTSCSGAAPPIEHCERGPAWADCGGTGAEPRFACSGFDCRWFANDCVAEGFEASPCSANDLCCRGGPPYGATPFDGSATDHLGVPDFTYGWGTAPWDATREATLMVVVGPTLGGARPSVVCADAADLLSGSVCQVAPESVSGGLMQQGRVVIGYVGPGVRFAGQTIIVEVIPDDAGVAHARVCSIPFSDAHSFGCDTQMPTRGCATTGTVTINSLTIDARSQMDVSATFADGSAIALRL